MNSETAKVAAELAEHLPVRDLEALAEAALVGTAGLAQFRQGAASGTMRGAVDDVAQLLAAGASPLLVAGSLLGAAHGVARERARQHVDVVWTGPTSDVGTSRLTAAVVVDLLDVAREEILLVSYATQSEPTIAAALESAVQRGVSVTMLLERAVDNPGYRWHTDPFPLVAARRLSWPRERRPGGASMHAKVIVVDTVAALVGSANATGHAMAMNLECGVLIRGGPTPARIRSHVLSLLDRHELVML